MPQETAVPNLGGCTTAATVAVLTGGPSRLRNAGGQIGGRGAAGSSSGAVVGGYLIVATDRCRSGEAPGLGNIVMLDCSTT